jgi:hypothetical protein
VKELVINLKKWYRGKGDDESKLRLSDGRQCCLGFYLRACGMKTNEIQGVATPNGVKFNLPNDARWLLGSSGLSAPHSVDGKALMEVNDDPKVNEKIRQTVIAKIFRRHGVKVAYKK